MTRRVFFCSDERIRPLFNTYLLGQSIGHIPFLLGNQLPVYLSMENRKKRTMTASLMHIGIKMVYKSARNVEYQSVLGMNVLTIRI